MAKKNFEVGYFEGAAGEIFQPLREFENKSDAIEYMKLNYLDEAEGQPQNVAIMKGKRIIMDGRIVGLN